MKLAMGTALFLAVAARAQQLPAPVERAPTEAMETAPTIHVQSRLVSVAMNVVDEHGAPVGGLKADDFELAEDGKSLPIATFDAESSTPLDIVLTIDASQSVWSDERLERDAAKSFVRSLLRPQDRVDLMDFADEVRELVPFTDDARRIDGALGDVKRGDATALYDAVYLASQRLGEVSAKGGARRVAVVISDGENTTHHGNYDMAIEQAQRSGVMIYALIIVPIAADAGRNTGGEHALIQMTRDTGGKYYYVEDKRDLAPAFQHVSEDLRTQYTVGYYAPRKALGDGELRHIHLQMKDTALRAKYALRYRTAYYATR
jgi:Ca-activated chloride channel family protein